MSISLEARFQRAGHIGAFALATLSVTWIACGESPPAGQPSLDGADLVAGTSIPRQGLLVIPRAGGAAELRAVEDPSRVRWQGTVPLPATREAHSHGRSVVLRDVDGEAFLFTPSGETLVSLGALPEDARWIPSPKGGAFIGSGFARLIEGETVRDLTIAGSVLWAAPAASGRAVALIETGDGPQLVVWEPGETEPATTRPVDSPGPAILTAWGQEIALPSEDGSEIVGYVLPELTPLDRTSLDAAPVTLAASASEHRVFAALAGRPRLVTIDRYAWRTVSTTRTAAPIREIRPGLTGGHLLAFDGSAVWSIGPQPGGVVSIPTEWRSDLPLVLPDGRVLGLSGGVVQVFGVDGSPAGEIEPTSDTWWIPVRWKPRFTTPVVRTPDSTRQVADGSQEMPSRMQGVGLTTMGSVSGRVVSVVDVSGDTGPAPTPVAGTVPAGFYAVATSSRQLESLEGLRAALERSGYPTEVLPRVDEANELWYRLMVGPYASRAEADDAAVRLRRQRGISAWIHEVSGSTPGIGGP